MPDPAADRVRAFAEALRPRLSAPGALRTDSVSRALYATDASLYARMPRAVLVPQTVDDVQAALEEAARHGLPTVPRGAGSSLAGQATGAGGLVIDTTKHLDAILDIDPEARTATVQPGVVLDHLNEALAPHGLMVGPDPAPSNRATLGGMVGNNATGTHSLLYGNVVHHLRGVAGFLAGGEPFRFEGLDEEAWRAATQEEGRLGALYAGLDALLNEHAATIERDTPQHWRRNSGYRLEHLVLDSPLRRGYDGRRVGLLAGEAARERNLAHLVCGSEGTLAVVTELTLGLVEKPERTGLGVVHFHTRDEALRAVTTILQTDPAAVELFDGEALRLTRQAPGFASRLTFVEGEPGGILITEYYGTSREELIARLDRLEGLLKDEGTGAYALVGATSPEKVANIWSVRKEGLGLIMGVKGDYKPHAFIEDASVPVEYLADYIAGLSEAIDATDTRAVYYAHASAGTLHVRPFINTKDAAEVEKMKTIARRSMELVRSFDGAVSSEHGDGLARSWLNEELLGPKLCEVYREVKRLFDPDGLLNPGPITDPPPMDQDLRMGPSYETIPVLEELDWSEDGGFARAIELCNGNGACRKLKSGTMCPSFMVTREEEQSTRGRANALRMALSGEVPPEELTGERVQEVMDLCIQCKACKTECPSNVDMAKIKTEWLAKVHEREKPSLRTRLFAHLPRIARGVSGTPLASMANAMSGTSLAKRAMQATLGISKRRQPPPFAREPFTKWFRRQPWGRTSGPAVVLFADTFSNYQHPEVARAAARFLHRAGYRVVVPKEAPCCGRTYLSKGFIQEAREEAVRSLDVLSSYAERGMPVIGLEPSCILTYRDELKTLLPDDPRVEALAAASVTFEEFVAREADAGRLDVRWREEEAGRPLILHGHCHQKALVGMGPSEETLRLPGYRVQTLDSGCCGMAGAFGYEEEHVDVSLAMAERVLAPAVRAAPPEAVICAPGTSCRAQIADAAGRAALHPAQVLMQALAHR